MIISKHAQEKYIFEMGKDNKYVCNIEDGILNLFNKAKKERMTAGLIKRIINNDFKEAEYYKYKRWRFVICNNIMVTIERDTFSMSPMYIKK